MDCRSGTNWEDKQKQTNKKKKEASETNTDVMKLQHALMMNVKAVVGRNNLVLKTIQAK